MTADSKNTILVDGERIDLRNRPLAALLAWLIPGAGHLYQGRYTKGVLFMVCILSAWVLGFALGGGHVVYATMAGSAILIGGGRKERVVVKIEPVGGLLGGVHLKPQKGFVLP